MNTTHVSFYLKANRIHIFVEALRGIGSPRRICFMLSQDGQSLALLPYNRRDFRSHEVPHDIYGGIQPLEISSYRLCSILADTHSWNKNCSYRVPGRIVRKQHLALFNLSDAKTI